MATTKLNSLVPFISNLYSLNSKKLQRRQVSKKWVCIIKMGPSTKFVYLIHPILILSFCFLVSTCWFLLYKNSTQGSVENYKAKKSVFASCNMCPYKKLQHG